MRFVGMAFLSIFSIILAASDQPQIAMLCFFGAIGLCGSVTYDVMSGARSTVIETQTHEPQAQTPVIQPTKVVEAVEERFENADGTAVQRRQIRQWN